MKRYIYLFRISFLELYYPIKVNEDIILLPSEENKKDKIESNYTYVDFNPQKYSYILIQDENPLDKNELEYRANIILSILAILLLNPLYIEEFYHYSLEKDNLLLQKASLVPFTKWDTNKKRNFLHGKLGVHILNEISNTLYQDLRNNPISNTIYSIIMEYIIAYRENIINISATIAWNVLEHIASRYWNKKNEEILYILRKEKFESYISTLKQCADNFIDTQIDKDKDVLLDNPIYKKEYKSLLKQDLTSNILNFSPVRFRILKMFGTESNSNKKLIKDMYEIRNKIYHDGLSIEEIKNQLGKDPIEIIVRFIPYLYRKILEFLGFIDKFFKFIAGYLIIKKELDPTADILNLKLNIPYQLEEIKLVEEINKIKKKLQDIENKTLNAKFFFKDDIIDVNIKISKEESEYSLTLIDTPNVLFNHFIGSPSKELNYPEDIIKLAEGFKIEFNQDNLEYQIKIGPPIEQKFGLHFSHPEIMKFLGKDDKEIEKFDKPSKFKIYNISIVSNK